jgi:hypothetical protein
MNKEQEKIAIKFIDAIKVNEGLMTSIDIDNDPIRKLFDFKTDIVVIDGLADLGLIDKSRKAVFRLTQRGWRFTSFKKLHFENKLQLINTKVILVIAIITILLNLYQTF